MTGKLSEDIIEMAKKQYADIIGFSPVSRFTGDNTVSEIYPDCKTVIGLGFRVLRGCYRGIEEGTTYYHYSTMGVRNMEESIMPNAMYRVSCVLESAGFIAVPQKRDMYSVKAENDTNPEVAYSSVRRGKNTEPQLDCLDAAVKCGLGERGMNGGLLTARFGPFIRYCFILTNAELEATPLCDEKLCDGCGECERACPGGAIANGTRDNLRCAVYYAGANGQKNPFLSPDAFKGFDDRMDILTGKAEITPEKAAAILKHLGSTCICGRVCDVACYCHLQGKGVLTDKVSAPFRYREPWSFDIGIF